MTTLKKVMTTLCLMALAKADPTLTTSECWGYGILSGFILSLFGFIAAIVLICFKKCLTEDCFKMFVNMLYALACGAIIGDAMIHILPEAFKSEETYSRYVSLIFICAIGFFIILERIFKGLGIAHQHWGEESHHHDAESNRDVNQPEEGQRQEYEGHNIQTPEGNKLSNTKKKEKGDGHLPSSDIIVPVPVVSIESALIAPAPKNDSKNQENGQVEASEEKKSCLQNLKGKGSAGYLNLLSSFVHNFFDGFGIGVGFATADMTIITPILIAIAAHQIPREMGDVGILIKNGFSTTQTVLCNGFINFMSLFGVIAGLALGSISDATQNYILVFVAGNFIYIGADIWKHLLNNKSLILNIVEVLMFSIGVGAMFLVLLAEAQ